jgi:antitoxin component HigA of HigAB toxin-antitoxin module
MLSGRCIYHANAELPQTSRGLLEMLAAAKPDTLLAVPYNLKLIAEAPGGIEALKQCMQVVSSGSALSDELGNRLTDAGVNVGVMFAG